MDPRQLNFEVGPIRPPNEARSLLLRFTRNCPWNQCRFCPVYKGKKFSLRSLEEIKRDIQAARDMAEDILRRSWALGYAGKVNNTVVGAVLADGRCSDSYRQVATWLYYGTGAVFLQDADNLVMRTDDLVEALAFLTERFPDLKRVTTYARSRTVVRKSVEALRRMRNAGLDRIHIGLESGCDPVLKLMKKGVTQAQHIEAGRRILEAGMELSEYVMPGLGGRALWREHAIETARTLNAINPHFIRLRSLRIPKRIPLYDMVRRGEFEPLTDDEVVREIRLFVEHLDGITSTVKSDHIMNLLEDVEGTLPDDKERMLATIDEYLNLPPMDRIVYRLGRRGGAYRSVSDMERNPETYEKIRRLVEELESEEAGKVETYIRELGDQYI